jgi:hypothetical protein
MISLHNTSIENKRQEYGWDRSIRLGWELQQTFDNRRKAKIAIGDAKDDPSLGHTVTRAALTAWFAYATTIRLRCNNSLSNYKLTSIHEACTHRFVFHSAKLRSSDGISNNRCRLFFQTGRRAIAFAQLSVLFEAVTWRYRLHLALAHTRLLLTAALNDVGFWRSVGKEPHDAQQGQHDVDACGADRAAKAYKCTSTCAPLLVAQTRCRAPSWRSTSAPALVIIHTSDIVSTVWEVIYRSHDECWRRRNGFWWAQIRYLGWFDSVTSLDPDMNNAILNLKFLNSKFWILNSTICNLWITNLAAKTEST